MREKCRDNIPSGIQKLKLKNNGEQKLSKFESTG